MERQKGGETERNRDRKMERKKEIGTEIWSEREK